MAKSFNELRDARLDTNLRNRVEVAADIWVSQQAERGSSEDTPKFHALAYDVMVDPKSAVDRLMRIVPIAAEQRQISVENDEALGDIVAALLDIYARSRPTQ